jgi:membrane-bound lytic murein transglycosylase B
MITGMRFGREAGRIRVGVAALGIWVVVGAGADAAVGAGAVSAGPRASVGSSATAGVAEEAGAGREPAAVASRAADPAPVRQAIARMRRAKLSERFIRAVRAAWDESRRDEIVALNVLGFLANEADYSAHFSPRAVQACRAFLTEHRSSFDRAQARYGVPREVVAALLWVETKHGRITGQESVAGVFFSLLQADHPDVLRATQAALAGKVGAPTAVQRAKVRARSRAKARWALTELRALARLTKRGRLQVAGLRGSFAGAFGLPQFLPSSYEKWARAAAGRRHAPDLYREADAIHSVANYLKAHGWRSRPRAARARALHDYNNSDGYVNVILKIADCVREKPAGRVLSSRRACDGG